MIGFCAVPVWLSLSFPDCRVSVPLKGGRGRGVGVGGSDGGGGGGGNDERAHAHAYSPRFLLLRYASSLQSQFSVPMTTVT